MLYLSFIEHPAANILRYGPMHIIEVLCTDRQMAICQEDFLEPYEVAMMHISQTIDFRNQVSVHLQS